MKIIFKNFLDKFKYELTQALPGKKAHTSMLPHGREYKSYDKNFISSAVSLIMFPDKDTIKFILTQRSLKLSKHSGQISFPGGKKEITDNSLWETAKRETLEEINIKLDNNNLIGQLTSLSIPVSKFNVYPYVCFLNKRPNILRYSKEVNKIYFVDISDFFNISNITQFSFYSNNKQITCPAYKLDGNYVWGATAMILAEFAQITNNILLNKK